ncbi:MAG TPA: serine hydrolase domain-containing protein [Gemmatimonadaceae bacterium]|nr:serine hydrolase domain-containing protein [Gemmatimonadaceae bacterium]
MTAARGVAAGALCVAISLGGCVRRGSTPVSTSEGPPPAGESTAGSPNSPDQSVAARGESSPMLAAAVRRAVADTVQRVLDRAVADSAFPGAYAVVGTRDGVIAEYGAGRIDWAADAPRPDRNTIWDMASLTKVIATTSAVEQLVGVRKIDLDAPVQRYLPEWTGPNKERVTLRHLLTHSSGLPAWRPLYKEATSPESAMALVIATQLDTLPGIRYVYSDLNAVLLGRIVERVSGERLDEYARRHVFEPIGMPSTGFRPSPALRDRIAPTEVDPWRQRHLRGEVHDENAYALGGVAGHAGLFSTAADLTRFAQMYLHNGTVGAREVIPAATLAEFERAQDTVVSRRALGWETPTGSNSAGHLMSARAFGHTGFTGTSIWMDPARDLFVILLTNRVNPTRENRRIGEVRVRLADAVVSTLSTRVPLAPAAGSPSSGPPSTPGQRP